MGSEMRIERAELTDALRQMQASLGETPTHAAAWDAVRDAGWLGLTVPEAQGGLAQSLTAACWMHEELGRALSPAPVLAALVAAEALKACPQSDARDAALEAIVGGDAPAVSLIDAEKGGDIAGGGRVIGVAGAESATQLLVIGEDRVALVPIAGVTAHPTWDQTRSLSDVTVGGDAVVLAKGNDAAVAAQAASVHLHVGLAADCVGAADALLTRTVAYLQERKQFDRPLAMFQALKHRCADLKVAIAQAEALLTDTLSTLAQGDGNAVLLAKSAKALASSHFRLVAEEALQLHGGMGMTEEHPCHLYLKRSLLNEHLGTPDDDCDVAAGRELVAAN